MIYISYFIIFICLIGLSYLFIDTIKEKNIFNVAAEQLKRRTDKSSKARIKSSQEVYKLVGNDEKINFFTKLDIVINMSNLKRRLPNINTELVLLFVAIITLFNCGIVAIILHNTMFVLLTGIMTLFFMYFTYHILSGMQIKKIDDNILQFANLLHSYSYIGDLMSVFETISPQLEEPLRAALNTCVAEARVDGDISGAIGRLSLKMRHRKLTELLQALDTGSRNNANYKAIITRCYESIAVYKGEREIRRATARGARINILLMLFIFILCIASLVVFLEMPLNLLFFSNTLGNIMFLFCCIVLIYTFWKFVTLDA